MAVPSECGGGGLFADPRAGLALAEGHCMTLSRLGVVLLCLASFGCFESLTGPREGSFTIGCPPGYRVALDITGHGRCVPEIVVIPSQQVTVGGL